MGFNTGLLLFDDVDDNADLPAVLLPDGHPTGDTLPVGDALGSREAVVGLGTWRDKIVLVDRYQALSLTTETDPAATGPVGQLARRVLVAYLHETSGSYGLALFENGQQTIAFYTQEGTVQHQSRAPNLSPPFAALPPPTDGDRFFAYIALFMGVPFPDWAYDGGVQVVIY